MQEEALPLLEEAEAERPPAGVVRLSHFAEVDGIYRVRELMPALLLAHLHLWSEETVAKGAGMLAVYSLGLGIPFIVAALAVGPFAAFLARFRAHLGLVEKAMGGLLVLTGIAFLTGVVGQASFWLLDTFPVLGKIG